MKNKQKAEEIAVKRLQMITPLLEDGVDEAKKLYLRRSVCEKTLFSDRTMRRWIALYEKEGFEGLKPKTKGRVIENSIPETILQEAIQLRREVPSRSIAQIIQILEWEDHVKPDEIKRSTLQDQLAKQGYSTRQMKIYNSDKTLASRRFQKPHRNMFWQSDIKFTTHIDKKPTYMVAFIDDCTRLILHSEIYPVMDQKIVQDCFRKALLKYGAPAAVYYDNGKQFRTKWMERACGKLNIRLLYTKPYSASSKGKVEKYNQTVDKFLAEYQLQKSKSLESLNRLYHVWMEECYQNKPHSALKDGLSPMAAFQNDTNPIRFLDPAEIANAFLSCESRKVDKTGCVSFNGQKYEIVNGLGLIGRTVDIIYDPDSLESLKIECENFPDTEARIQMIGSYSGPRPELPKSLETVKKTGRSRLLDAADKRNKERIGKQKSLLSYKGMTGDPNV